MRSLRLVMILSLLGAAVAAQNVSETLSALRSGDAKRATRAIADARDLGSDAIGRLFEGFADLDSGVRDCTLRAVEVCVLAKADAAKREVAAVELLRIARESSSLTNDERSRLIRLGGEVGTRLATATAMRSFIADPAAVDSALFALERMASPAGDAVLVEVLEDATAAKNDDLVVRTIAALGRRGQGALHIERHVDLSDSPVDRAARHALASLGRLDDLRILVEAANYELSGGAADLLLSVQRATAKFEDDRSSWQILLGALSKSPVTGIRHAAIVGRMAIHDDADLEDLLAMAADDSPAIRALCSHHLTMLDDPDLDRRLFDLVNDARLPPFRRGCLLPILAGRLPEIGVKSAVALAEDPSAELRSAAASVLCRADAATAVGPLTRLMSDPDPGVRATVVGGMINFIERSGGQGDRLTPWRPLFVAAIRERVVDGSEATTFFDALRRMPSADLVGVLDEFESRAANPPREAIAKVRVGIADMLLKKEPAVARGLFLRALTPLTDRNLRAKIRDSLAQLGATSNDPAGDEGFVTGWHLLGPLPRTDKSGLSKLPFDPMTLDLSKPITSGNDRIEWISFTTKDPDGNLDFTVIFDRHEDVSVIAIADIDVTSATKANLCLGSDDGVAAWLNGTLIHSNYAWRGVELDDDVIPVDLAAGKNHLVIRVNQGGGGFGLCARFLLPNGRPLVFAER